MVDNMGVVRKGSGKKIWDKYANMEEDRGEPNQVAYIVQFCLELALLTTEQPQVFTVLY